MDDDTFVNAKQMEVLARGMHKAQRGGGVYMGSSWRRGNPIRDVKHKYYLAPESYFMNELPPFIEGP